MLADLTAAERKEDKLLDQEVGGHDRFVDFGVVLRVVRMDLLHGEKLLRKSPPLAVLREHHRGGMVDTKAAEPFICGLSQDPTVWFCSEDQETVLLHGPELKPRLLVYGSEGAGKTATLAMWHFLRLLETLGQGLWAGQTAPTNPRLSMFHRAAEKWWHPRWYRFKTDANLYTFADGSKVECISTHQQSEAAGARVQGNNWARAGSDELQDHSEYDPDIEMRGREGPEGVFRRFATATAKDSSEWRSFRDSCEASGLWERRTLAALRSPFVWPRFWEEKKKTLPPREYRRRILAQDVGVELAVYYGWSRAQTEHPIDFSKMRPGNLVRLPKIATDMTPDLLAHCQYQSFTRPGAKFSLLVGHDPGNIYSTSIVLRLLMFGEVPTWVVVGELQTKQTTANQHAAALREYLQREFYCEMPGGSKALIIPDPHGRGESATDFGTVYQAFAHEGLDAISPAGITMKIKRAPRVGMMNRLLCSSDGLVRLVVATDETNRPVAPILVDAFESLEKAPGDDDPEGSQRKDRADKTHAPAACGYALWPFEQETITQSTVAAVLKLFHQKMRRVG